MAGESLSPNERVEEIDFALNVINEMGIEGYNIITAEHVIIAIDKLLDRRLELNEGLEDKN